MTSVARLGLNVIRVGADRFRADDDTHVSAALTLTRSTLALAGLVVDPVVHWTIPTDQADGRDVVDDHAEAQALTAEWAVPDAHVDVFVVTSFLGPTAGLAPVPGPCDKSAPGMTGVVVEIVPGATGQLLAHELGHYLGLPHTDDPRNLMYPTVPNGGILTGEQAATMRRHCAVQH